MDRTITEITLNPIKRIALLNGDVLQGIKSSDPTFCGFGEAYFSYIHFQAIKAWKRHKNHTANFVVPYGKVKVMVYKEHLLGKSIENYPKKFILAENGNQFQRLTIPPGYWYGFEGLAEPFSLIFSFLNGEHASNEQDTLDIKEFMCPWDLSYD